MLKRGLLAWRSDCPIAPKDLRKTLQTTAILGRWNLALVVRYVGHSPANMREKHYLDDRRETLMPALRSQVAGMSDAAIDEVFSNCNNSAQDKSNADELQSNVVDITDVKKTA